MGFSSLRVTWLSQCFGWNAMAVKREEFWRDSHSGVPANKWLLLQFSSPVSQIFCIGLHAGLAIARLFVVVEKNADAVPNRGDERFESTPGTNRDPKPHVKCDQGTGASE